MRIATWNVNSLASRLPRLDAWLESTAPDVLCLQETKMADEAFPAEHLQDLGYTSAHRGDGRWNGVAILSRVGLTDVVPDLPSAPGFPEPDGPPEPRFLSAVCGGLHVVCVYVPNGRTVSDPHFDYKLRWFECLRDYAATPAATERPFAILGDFNVAPHDDDVWDIADFADSTHVTVEERDALQRIEATGLTDVRPTISKGRPFTFWDYRGGNFHKGLGMRIDLVLANPACADRVVDAYIDRDARKPGRKGSPAPSDHAPLVVDIDL